MVAVSKRIHTVGRRKTSVARVFLNPSGKGNITVNNVALEEYFPEIYQSVVKYPLVITEVLGKVDIYSTVKGGGISGQAGALRHAIARALNEWNRDKYRPILKHAGLLTRDPRMVERKKYGYKKARKSPQYSKR